MNIPRRPVTFSSTCPFGFVTFVIGKVHRMGVYSDTIFPRLMSACLKSEAICRLKAELLAKACGAVLEIGIGTWSNLQLYDRGRVSSIIGVEPLAAMKTHHQNLRLDIPYEIVYDAAEHVYFPNGSFDTVTSTFALCSIRDLDSYMIRVLSMLKGGGRLLFLEHGIGSGRIRPAVQWVYNFIQKPFTQGCSITKDYHEITGCKGIAVTDFRRIYEPSMPLLTEDLYYIEAYKK